MKKLLLIALISVFSFQIFAQATGLIFDEDAYRKSPRLSPALRFSDANIPTVYSLKKYCPTAGDQGQIGSCVGWSSGYAALTISWAAKHEVTSQDIINKHAKSALFIYNQLKGPDIGKPCGRGLNIDQAMRWLVKNGDCDITLFNPNSCYEFPSEEIKTLAHGFPVESYHTLISSYDPIVSAVRTSISQDKPVVGCFKYFPNSFDFAGMHGVWPTNTTELQHDDDSHAMCIVGYDDINKQFEILNSWGTGWGNNGYFKISYQDFAAICQGGYNLTLGYTKDELDKTLTLTGSFYFKKFLGHNDNNQQNEFAVINPFFSGNYYTLKEGSVKKDDFYRLVISNAQKDSYLYVFSLKPDHSVEVLFPLSASDDPSKVNDIPLIPASNARIELPFDDSKAYSTDIIGEDILCLLYSNQKIADIKKIAADVNSMSGELPDRLKQVLGNRMVPGNEINYINNGMSFLAKTTQGNIVPIILKVYVTQ